MNQQERKKELIAQSALHRAEIVMAKETVRSGLRPQALARGATEQLAINVYSVFRKQGGAALSAASLQTALPLLITAVSGLMKFKSKKSVLKIVMSSMLVAGVTTAVTAAVSRKKRFEAEEMTREEDVG